MLNRRDWLVLNDNNFPFSIRRHVGSGRPPAEEMIEIRPAEPVG